MTSNLLSPPIVEPISLVEMKAFLKLDHDAEDDMLLAFISAARLHLEHLTGRHFISQTWRVVIDGPVADKISLPCQPLTGITSAAILNADGDLIALETESFNIHQTNDPAIVSNRQGLALTTDQRLQLDLATGFGPTPEDVPAPLQRFGPVL